ncbi:protein FAR1-RELATED SEQUENCE 5-like [Asparagus officinalis]|uniref:protein FAR1-RELATED SEQUENCE 5-like n=1 Tax=Asparagus officinalis TaxID=4686 RepID=UPI00098E0154|nr:protein FAR1-RELATED SEQUENCE 5-like [Asparagus officinalis]XP_020255132.1 protein FAR1-RELATED SEQUENCE 5-like [Asparagus officinalis]XP_020275857.1 protein FAR1-RELATED SEQUENCE 5-like [Asparagus officinalis]
MVFDKRYKEMEAEYHLLFRIVHCKMEVSILIHAREVYTKAIFKAFQAQFEDSLKSSITKCVYNGEQYIFTVVRDGFLKERLVKREGQFTVSCSCRMFETIGVLCRHCIKVMTEGRETTLIKKIPEQYILERWTKNARVDNVVQDMHGHEIVENPRLKQTSRYRSLCSKFVRLASRASESEKTYEAIDMEADKLVKMVEDMLRVEINGEKDVEDEAPNVLVDCSNNVTVVNAKGFKKREATHRGKRRVKGGFEAQLSKNKNKLAQVTKVPRHCDAMDQSHVPSSQQSQVPMHSPITDGNGRYMPLLFHPYNIHGHQLNMESSQEFVQSNIMGFSFAQDPEKSNYEQSSTPRQNISSTFKGDSWSATPLHSVHEQRR